MDTRPKLSIVRPGEVIVTVVGENPTDSEKSGQEKFDSCVHRSEHEKEETVKYCCGSRTTKGFVCNRFGIFVVRPEHCAACKDYQSKTNA